MTAHATSLWSVAASDWVEIPRLVAPARHRIQHRARLIYTDTVAGNSTKRGEQGGAIWLPAIPTLARVDLHTLHR